MGVLTWWAAERTANELRRARYDREHEAKARWARENPKAAYIVGQLKASVVCWPIVLGGLVAGWCGMFPVWYRVLIGLLVAVASVVWFVLWAHSGGDWLLTWLIFAFSVGTGKALDILLNE